MAAPRTGRAEHFLQLTRLKGGPAVVVGRKPHRQTNYPIIVRELKSGRLEMAVTDLGPTKLKNIDKPIRAYLLEVGKPTLPRPMPKWRLISSPLAAALKELGVRYVLEGSVQRDQNRVRVNAQLIDAESGGWRKRARPREQRQIGSYLTQDGRFEVGEGK
jgi:hypothetical protein